MMENLEKTIPLQRQNAVVFPEFKLTAFIDKFQDETFEFFDFEDDPNVTLHLKSTFGAGLPLEERYKLNKEFINTNFGDVQSLYQYISCDHPACMNKFEDFSKVQSISCKKCKRNIDICLEHEILPDSCVFCIDEEIPQVEEKELETHELEPGELETDELDHSTPEISLENSEEQVNRCVQCGMDLGTFNPRQFCGKTFCENTFFQN